MEENKVKCPLCEGHGELSHLEIALFTTPELRKRLDARIAEILEGEEILAGATSAPATRNFEREVHTWNPQLPMWRRSPKE
jgi:hypothetical protein